MKKIYTCLFKEIKFPQETLKNVLFVGVDKDSFIEVKNKKVSIEHYNEIKNLFKGEYDKKRKCTRYNITFGKGYLKWMEATYKTKAIFKTIQ